MTGAGRAVSRHRGASSWGRFGIHIHDERTMICQPEPTPGSAFTRYRDTTCAGGSIDRADEAR